MGIARSRSALECSSNTASNDTSTDDAHVDLNIALSGGRARLRRQTAERERLRAEGPT